MKHALAASALLGALAGALVIWLQRGDPAGWGFLLARGALCALVVAVPAAAVLGAAVSLRSYKQAFIAALATGAVLGAVAGVFFMWLAWSHNPQSSVHGGDEGVAWSYLLSLGAGWAVAVGAPAMALLAALAAVGVSVADYRARARGAS